MNIGFTYDLKSEYLQQGLSLEEAAEFDQEDTIESIAHTLQLLGHGVDRIGNLKSLIGRLYAGDRWDLVFNICEGRLGVAREAQVPALLEAFNIPYTFSDAAAMVYTLDKALAKLMVRDAGIRTPQFLVVYQPEDCKFCHLTYPLFAKPLAEGTSKGIDVSSKINNSSSLLQVCTNLLHKFHEPVLVEEYLPGREFTVGIIGTGAAARVVGAMEIQLQKANNQEAYSFDNKIEYEKYVKYTPIKGELLTACADFSLAAWRTLSLRDGGRVDVRFDRENQLSFIEANPLAGLNPMHSDLPILCRLNGITFEQLIQGILASALQRIAELGDDAEVVIEPVTNIPVLDSGKLKIAVK